MEIIKVEFLKDLGQTLTFLQSFQKEGDEIRKIEFYAKGKKDDEHPYERNFEDFDEVKRDYKQEFYDRADKITVVVKKSDDLETIHCDKETGSVAVVSSKEEKKELRRRLTEENDIKEIVKDDGCVYYQFEFGQIGKFDPSDYSYYLYKDGEWEVSGSVMRWVEDPAYEYTIIGGQDAIHR